MESVDDFDLLKPVFGVAFNLRDVSPESIYCAVFTPRAVITKADPEIYMYSQVISNMVRKITREELASAGISTSGISESETTQVSTLHIIVFGADTPVEYISGGTIDSAESFCNYINFADQYGLNIPYICAQIDFTYWFLEFREKQRDIWRANNILLTNIDQKYHTPKFQQVNAPQPYPVGAVKIPKMVNLTERQYDSFLSKEQFALLVSLLIKNGATLFAKKLVITVGVSIPYCDLVVLNPHLLSMRSVDIPPSVMFYAMRIMYLEELSMYNGRRGPGRFITTLDTASRLPQYTGQRGLQSPYNVSNAIGVSGMSESLLIPLNFNGQRGIATPAQFNERFRKYAGEIVDNIEAIDCRVAFCGSGFCAAAIINPLEYAFDTFEEYLEEYYPSHTAPRVEIKQENYGTFYEVDSDDENPAGKDVEKQRFNNPSYGLSDIDIAVECDFATFDSCADRIYKSINRNGELNLVRVPTENKHKYSITGGRRVIDLFHVDNIDAVIIKFHRAEVRGYALLKNEEEKLDAHVVVSFITAAKVGLCVDLRWTSNRKDPRDTVLKGFQRGFGTLLCRDDKKSLIEYINSGHANRTSSWPPHATNEQGWRRRHFTKLPIYGSAGVATIFNPSVSRVGIHQSIDSIPNRASFDNILGKQIKRGTARTRVEYRGPKGDIPLPFACPSIGNFM